MIVKYNRGYCLSLQCYHGVFSIDHAGLARGKEAWRKEPNDEQEPDAYGVG